MNKKRVEVSISMYECYEVTCYIDNMHQYSFTTDNPLAVGFIIQVFLTREQTSETLMCELIKDIV